MVTMFNSRQDDSRFPDLVGLADKNKQRNIELAKDLAKEEEESKN